MNKTGIEYADYSWNPAPGCTMVSEGCVNCWAQSMAARLKAMGQEAYNDLTDDRGRWTGKVAMLAERLDEPLKVKKPSRIVVNFMGDLFHESVKSEFIADVFITMKEASQHIFFVLTKRPVIAARFLGLSHLFDIPILSNIIIGTTVENQKCADERRANLEYISMLGWKTLVSYEPALGMVDWSGWQFLDWMAAGGESGPRPMHPDWARAARDFCMQHGIKFFFKQWGNHLPVGGPEHYAFENVGKHKAGRILDGRTWDDLPDPHPGLPPERGKG